MEKILFEFHGETRYLTWSGDDYYIKNSFLRCYISTDRCNKLRLRIDIHQTPNDLFSCETIFQGPGPLKYLQDDIKHQCAQGGFKLKFITGNIIKFKSKDPDNPQLIQFGYLLLKMKELKQNLDEPFGMTVHDMSLDDMCSKYNSENEYKKKPNWTQKSKSKKENELSNRRSLPLSNKTGVMNRAKIRQSMQVPTRKSTPNVQLSNKDVCNRNFSQWDKRNLENESFQTKPSHTRFTSDHSDENDMFSQLGKRLASFVPPSSKQTTPNVMATSIPERNFPRFYGSHPPGPNLSPLRSPRSPSLANKRPCSLTVATVLSKKLCNSQYRSENKENRVTYKLDKEGLENVGNTCYMNASLQAVFQSLSFVKEMIATYNEVEEDLNDNSLFGAISNLIIERNKDFSVHLRDHYASFLIEIKEAIGLVCKQFVGNNMQDVPEFLNRIVSTMKEEISVAIEKSEKDSLINPIDSLFKMTLIVTLTCLKCDKESKTSQDAYEIALKVPDTSVGTLQSALETYFAEELREFTCSECGHEQSTARTTISCFPKLLNVYLMRYNVSEGETLKDGTFVDVPDVLMLQDFVEKQGQKPMDSGYRSKESTESNSVTSSVQNHEFQMGEGDDQEKSLTSDMPLSYKLKSAICHFGDVDSGHYVCYGIDFAKERCRMFNDSCVKDMSMNEVSKILKEDGYLFIYEVAA